jgi:hemolysin activation/secretion protein
VATLELRYDLPAPTSLGRLQWFGFFDTGRITLNKTLWGAGAVTNATNSNSYGLSGAGLGVTLTQASRYSVRAFWARILGSNPGRSTAGNFSDGQASTNRFAVLATALF